MTIKRHVPKALRYETDNKEKRGIRFGIGTDEGSGSFAMSFGPTVTEIECLDEIGERNQVIIKFHSDGTDEIMWRWDHDADCWVSV